ncbi:MAG: hypothetical protein Gaeavirus14_18 [Gaeavirus sp.]|uniref:Uncharacterized protein n=1 Tax=Gaeavirus sp. TaxID=2487767 RepID=A0A3G4ZZ52_9VIRU|nr:MAG: hypothetical protein Gaeavirus14_3 [Gaeavirus sp.]AYV80188.1 MAG: hypothetical protein Gaeavirus14_18 [Gaeavirus sp.]
MNKTGKSEYFELFGEAILLASMQFAIGSVEMSSKFSVKNFSKDQATLQSAADALSDYLRIGIMWTIGLTILFYARYDKAGIVMSLITNLLIIAWIYFSYLNSFAIAAKTYGLIEPTVSLL